MSRVSYRKCDNCERRFDDGDPIITVLVPRPRDTAPHNAPDESVFDMSSIYRLAGLAPGAARPTSDEFEFCSPQCVVAAFIAAGAIAGAVNFNA